MNNYPLAWPTGVQRTPPGGREYGRFGSRSHGGYGIKDVTLFGAVSRVIEEAAKFTRVGRRYRIDPDDIVISTNVPVRLDGMPRSGQKAPTDPGVAVYFKLDEKPQVISCDKYTNVEQNVAAVAAALSALRTLERHGSGMMERAFTGFAALPNLSSDAWHTVLCVSEDEPFDVVEKKYKRLRSDNHPDKSGGDAYQFNRIQKAWDQYKDQRG